MKNSPTVTDNTEPDSSTKPELPWSVGRIEITRIQVYQRNPRRHQNPEYDRIKDSIRAEGLDQPLVITQEPGAEDYVLQAGGNTRLRILKELYEETGEERFYWVDCVFKPWVQESTLLFAHLRENELRGELPFIDKAHAVYAVKVLLENELDVAELSQRQLSALFKEHGFSLSSGMISRMGYALHRLWPLIPETLNAGLGKPQVEKIRALERAAQLIWQRRQLGDEATFDTVFSELCRRYDGPEWDIQLLRGALENEIAEESEQDLQVIRLELDASLAGREFTVVESELMGIPKDESVQGNDESGEFEPIIGDRGAMSSQRQSEARQPDPYDGDTSPSIAAPENTAPVDLENVYINDLRARICGLAVDLAERNGLGGLVQPLPHQGLGFFLSDVPAAELAELLDEEMLGQVSMLWWQLASCAETTSAPSKILLHHLAPDTTIYRVLSTQDAGLLFESIWTPDPARVGHLLWQQLNDRDWRDLLALMAGYRALKQRARESGTSLWIFPEDEH